MSSEDRPGTRSRDEGPAIEVEVVLATPRRQQVIRIEATEGCTAREAVRRAVAAGLDVTDAPDVDLDDGPIGIFGERVDGARVLVADDRVELYRALRRDPRERRRQRAAASARRDGRSP